MPHLLSNIYVIRHICCWQGGGGATTAARWIGFHQAPPY